MSEQGITRDVLSNVRHAVCAVGYHTLPLSEFQRDPTSFIIAGTGFLVRDSVVISNRHVFDALKSEQARIGFPNEQMHLWFTYAVPGRGVMLTGVGIQDYALPYNKKTGEERDIAFFKINRQGVGTDFEHCRPVRLVQSKTEIRIGEPLAMFGFPFGNQLLTDPSTQRITRFGPILQQGHVSALSPYDGMKVNEILMDVRTAGGMSGSPVFRRDTGEVFGINCSGTRATAAAMTTTAHALPLDARFIDGLLLES